MPDLDHRAILWGLVILVGLVIVLMLVEGLIAGLSPEYTLRAPGRFLSYREYVVHGYDAFVVVTYLTLDLVETAVPCCVAASSARRGAVANAIAVIVLATVIGWLLFGWVFYSPAQELIGFSAALVVGAVTGSICGRCACAGIPPR